MEPHISVLNLDDYVEKDLTSNQDELLIAAVKIKQEPKYEGYDDDEDDGFEDVGTFEGDPVGIILDEGSGK